MLQVVPSGMLGAMAVLIWLESRHVPPTLMLHFC
jgi:hypothetical protein